LRHGDPRPGGGGPHPPGPPYPRRPHGPGRAAGAPPGAGGAGGRRGTAAPRRAIGGAGVGAGGGRTVSLWDTLRTAIHSLRANTLRSILSMLGIIIGVAAVVSVVSIGTGSQQ